MHDDELMEAINQHADRAERDRTMFADFLPLATELHAAYPHRAEPEIREQLESVWRARGLFWVG